MPLRLNKIILGVSLLSVIIIATFWFFPSLNHYLSKENLLLEELRKKAEEWPLKIERLPQIEELSLPDTKNLELKEVSTPGPLPPLPQTEKGTNALSSDKIIYWTNLNRESEGIETLKDNEILDKVAEERSNDMFEKQYFEHISPEGIGAATVAEEFGYQYLRIGENIALGNFKSEEELVSAWMKSQGHRENILNSKFKEIGVSVKKNIFNGKNTFIAVQIFAAPLSECPTPDKNLKNLIEDKNEIINALIFDANNLKKEIGALEAESESLYNQGQQLIKQERYDEVPSINAKLEENNEKIKEKVQEYNELVSKIDGLSKEVQNSILDYNSQVSAFNQCIAQ